MMKKQLTLTLALLLSLLLLFSGCAQPAAEPTPEPTQQATAEPTAEPTVEPPSQEIVLGETTCTDVLGREIVIAEGETPERIVSLTATNTEILFALGLGDKVVGVDVMSNYPAEAVGIDVVGDFNGPNVEAIVALEPDLILAGNKLQIDAVQTLEDLDLRVAAVEATLYDEIDESIQLVGKLTRAEDQAQALVDTMTQKQQEITALEKIDEEVTAYFVLSAGEYGNWTSGPGSFINDMMLSLGITPITQIEGGAPWMDYSIEELVSADPAVILMSSQSGVDVETLSGMVGYKDLTAVKEGNVKIIDADIISRPGPRIVDALQAMFDAVYGS